MESCILTENLFNSQLVKGQQTLQLWDHPVKVWHWTVPRKATAQLWRCSEMLFCRWQLSLPHRGLSVLVGFQQLVEAKLKQLPPRGLVRPKGATIHKSAAGRTKGQLGWDPCFFCHLSLLLEERPWSRRRGWSAGSSRRTALGQLSGPRPAGRTCGHGGVSPTRLRGPGLPPQAHTPERWGKGSLLTFKFLGVTQEEQISWELQVEEGQAAEAD